MTRVYSDRTADQRSTGWDEFDFAIDSSRPTPLSLVGFWTGRQGSNVSLQTGQPACGGARWVAANCEA